MKHSYLFLVVSFILFFSFNAKTQINLTNGLVAYYPFSGNVNDASGNGYNGTMRNGVGFSNDRFGNPNSALELDGINDFVEVLHDGKLGSKSAFSYVVYFNSQSSEIQTLLGRRNQANSSHAQFQTFINWTQEPGVGYGHSYTNNTECSNVFAQYNVYVNTGSNSVNLNQWHCVVGTFDGVTQKIYLDGVLKTSETTSLAKMDSCTNTPMTIGYYTNLDPQFFKGKIDEVRIYNRAINQQEVELLCSNVPLSTTSSCIGFQYAIGGAGNDRAYDVAAGDNNEFYVVGTTQSFGASGDDVLVSKMNLDGAILWSRRIGNAATETVRRVKSTSDGGVLITGQTRSFSNPAGDILCMKLSSTGSMVWVRKFGVGSSNGDLGMDVIETTDGYAISGLLNVSGGVADAVVIKLDPLANIAWTKRYDHFDGDDGVGIVQKDDTLIVAVDLQNGTGNYAMTVMKLKLNDGSFITAKKLTPSVRGIFNPYLYKNPAQPGYIISGHTVDVTSYANMKHTIITLNDNLDIINTKLISINPVTNDFFTGIVPLSDGSFIGTASPANAADGYVYKINKNNSVAYAKRFNAATDRRLYRLTTVNEKVVAVGGTVANGQEDFFITAFNLDGTMPAACNVEDVSITVEQPVYTVSNYTWPSINTVSFTNTDAGLGISIVEADKKDLCPSQIDFGFTQNVCATKSVQFSSNLVNAPVFEWDFGNGQTNTSLANPSVLYADYGTYAVKLKVKNGAGCYDSTVKSIFVSVENDNLLISTSDTTICKGDSIILKSGSTGLNACWQSSSNQTVTGITDLKVAPAATTTYHYTTQALGANLVINGDFSQGSSGFLSEYIAQSPNNTEGQYWIANNPVAWNPNLSNCKEHTTGTGTMMMVNAAPVAGKKVWSQTVSVLPNTSYAFSTWIQSLAGLNPASLRFSINNNVVGGNVLASSNSCQWNSFFTTWNSGESTSAVITIVNNNTIADGNDFALDDIYFGTVSFIADSVVVKIINKPVVFAGVDTTICSATSLHLNATVSGLTWFSWSPSTYLSNATITNPIATPGDTVSYIAEVINAAGCKATDTLTISVVPQPSIKAIGDTTICAGSGIILQTTSTNALNFLWQPASTLSSSIINSPVANPVSSTEYIVTAGNGFCFAKDTVNIKVNPLPVVTISNDTAICFNAEVQLSATGGTEYSWSPPETLSASLISNPLAKPVTSTLYKVAVKNATGCVQHDSVFVEVQPVPPLSITPSQAICTGETVSLTAGGGDVYNWQPVTGISNPASSTVFVTPVVSTVYKVYVKHTICAVDDSATTTVTVNPMPVVGLSKSNDIDCANLQSQLVASGGNDYEWTIAPGISTTNIANPVVSPLQTTTYKVKVGIGNCFTEDSITVNFLPEAGANTLHIPTAFTPNKDGLNDVYRVGFRDALKFSMKIFNRWGEMIYATTDPLKGWDGTYKGVPQPIGAYVFLIKGDGVCTGVVTRKGTFALIR